MKENKLLNFFPILNTIKIKENNLRTNINKKIKNLILAVPLLIIFISSSNYELIEESYFPNITLKIRGTGNKFIFSKDENFLSCYYPNEVYINKEKQNNVSPNYLLNQSNNIVELVWRNRINNSQYMFAECSDIYEIDLSNFNTSDIVDMQYMFFSCSGLNKLNLSNFDTSKVTSMTFMFRKCTSLVSIDLSSFDTSKVLNMRNMFGGCSKMKSLNLSNFYSPLLTNTICMFCDCISLVSLYLSNFETSEIGQMGSMFRGCTSLVSLDLSSFNTTNVRNTDSLFYNCKSLTSLNITHFNTKNLLNMQYMFYNCSLLTSLNLSNFINYQMTNLSFLFYGCNNLEYINLHGYIERSPQSNNFLQMFDLVPDNVVVCLNEENTRDSIFPQLINKTCLTIDCSENWRSKHKKLIKRNNTCNDGCEGDYSISKFEYGGICYENCPNRYIYNENNLTNNQCNCQIEECNLCPLFPLLINVCTKCNDGYYPMENDPINFGKYINCYDGLKGYYLDENDSIFKKCFDSCESCEKGGDIMSHNCTICKAEYNFTIENNYTKYLNCYRNCEFYHYFDNNNIYQCTKNFSCPSEYPKLIEELSECIKDNDNINYISNTNINSDYISNFIKNSINIISQ